MQNGLQIRKIDHLEGSFTVLTLFEGATRVAGVTQTPATQPFELVALFDDLSPKKINLYTVGAQPVIHLIKRAATFFSF